jgi:prepilin-type processing-associated H-X9-DG protein
MEMYSETYNQYIMPAKTFISGGGAGSSASDYNWYGTQVLGKLMGVKGGNQQAILDRTAKLLDCPSNDRPLDPTGAIKFHLDYTYNNNFGDTRGQDPNDASYPSYKTWAYFKKRNQVPQNVACAMDSWDPGQFIADDDRFMSLDDLTWKKHYGGNCHQGGKANVLFHDGVVRLVKVFTVPKGAAWPTSSAAMKPEYTQLADWMIRVAKNDGSESATTVQTSRWMKGRELPF